MTSPLLPSIEAPAQLTKSGKPKAPKVNRSFITLGARVLGSIIDWQEWIHRKVESVDLEPGDGSRRRVSFDCTPVGIELGEFSVPDVTTESRMVPLTLMAKELLERFDLSDDAGRALPLVGSESNALMSGAALGFIVWIQTGKKDKKLLELWPTIWEIVTAEARQASKAATLVISQLGLDSVAEQIFLEVASNFLLIAVIPESRAGHRQVIKLSYRWREGRMSNSFRRSARRWLKNWAAGHGLASVSFTVETGSMYAARSYHLEVVGPPELLVRNMILPVGHNGVTPASLSGSNIIHAKSSYNRFGSILTSAHVFFELNPGTLLARMWWAALGVVALYFILVATPRSTETLLRSPDAATALLLFVPALLIALNARQQENVLAGQLLLPLRVDAILLSIVLFTSGGALVLGLPPHAVWSLWSVSLTLVLILFATLTAGIVRLKAERYFEAKRLVTA